MFNSIAKFVTRLTGREIHFHQTKQGEPIVGVTARMDKFFDDVSKALDDPAMKMLGVLEPGKTYVLQIDTARANWDSIENLAAGLRDEGITIAVIDKNVNFVSVPEGYKIIKEKQFHTT